MGLKNIKSMCIVQLYQIFILFSQALSLVY